jgi:hypothetical protein
MMFVKAPTLDSRTYVHVSNEAEIHVVRHEEDEEDMFSVRFGDDEQFVLEFGEGFLPRFFAALEAKSKKSKRK